MPEVSKDPAIKLFGKTIQLPDAPAPAPATEMDVDPGGGAASSPPPAEEFSAKDSSCSEAEGGEDEQLQKVKDFIFLLIHYNDNSGLVLVFVISALFILIWV